MMHAVHAPVPISVERCKSRPGETSCSCPRCQRYAFAVQATALEPFLLRYLSRFIRNPSDALDLVQETYVRLLGPSVCLTRFRSPRAIVLTVARNLAFDWLRHRAIVAIDFVPNLESLQVMDESADSESNLDSVQQLARIAAAVSQLPRRCRQIFTLRKVYGYSQKDIARRMGISVHTVEQQLTKGMRRVVERVPEVTKGRKRIQRNRRRARDAAAAESVHRHSRYEADHAKRNCNSPPDPEIDSTTNTSLSEMLNGGDRALADPVPCAQSTAFEPVSVP